MQAEEMACAETRQVPVCWVAGRWGGPVGGRVHGWEAGGAGEAASGIKGLLQAGRRVRALSLGDWEPQRVLSRETQ